MSAVVIPLHATAPAAHAVDRILRLPQVRERVGLSTSTLYRRMAAGQFPRAVALGSARTVGWRESEITAWIVAQGGAT